MIKKTPPFKKMVVAAILLGFRLPAILKQLGDYHFNCSEEELGAILDEVRDAMPNKEKLDAVQRFDLVEDRSWYEVFGVYELADFYVNHKVKKEEYYKWMADCYWILHNKDIMTLIHIFMFNGDSDDDVSDFVSVKFKKKLGMETLKFYRELFWNCSHLNAKDACYFYKAFADNAVIVRNGMNGMSEIDAIQSGNDAPDQPVVFNDSNYIKWKMGYNKITVPSASDFVDRVMKDAYFKYQEVLNMTRSIEEHTEDGSNDKLGAFTMNRTIRRNVEERRVKTARAWMEMFLKASAHKRDKSSDEEDFFKKMAELSIQFDQEKLTSVTEVPGMLDDIKGDM